LMGLPHVLLVDWLPRQALKCPRKATMIGAVCSRLRPLQESVLQSTFPVQRENGADREIIERARAGDADALGALYDLYFPRIYRYVLARTGSPPEAEDLTAEVFLKMLGAIGSFQWKRAPFAAWLFRIARNHVISAARKNGLRRQETPLAEAVLPSDHDTALMVETHLSFQEVMLAAHQLPPAQREVLWLRFAVGLSVADTARVLGKRDGNVKVLQHKAIARLQKLLVPPPVAVVSGG